MSEELKLGQIITTPQQRDAIHIAVAPVLAGMPLERGEFVRLNTDRRACACLVKNSIGVVDPFLNVGNVLEGQTFWLYLHPGSITSLRHEWTHPALPNEQPAPSPDKAASEKWLRDFCESADCPGYDDVMQGIQGYFATDDDYYRGGTIDSEYLHFSGSDAHGEIPPEFWVHAEIVLGKKLELKPAYFSCSC